MNGEYADAKKEFDKLKDYTGQKTEKNPQRKWQKNAFIKWHVRT